MGDILKELPIRFDAKKVYEKHFGYHIMKFYSKTTCGCCGETPQITKNLKCRLCGTKFQYASKETKERGYKDNSIYYMTTESNEGDLLFRYFLVWCNERYGHPASNYRCEEVIRYQVNSKGKWQFARKDVSSMMWYWDFRLDSPLSKHRADIANDRYGVIPYALGRLSYPKWCYWKVDKIHEIYEDSKKHMICGRMNPMELFDLQFKYTEAETMLKLGRYDMINFIYRNREYIPEAFMMARKGLYPDCNKYDILRDYWYDCKTLGLDLKNVKYLNPEGIEQKHNKLNEKVRWVKDKESVKSEIKCYEQEYLDKKSKYMDIDLGNEKYSIKLLPNIKSFYDTSVEFSNCVYRAGYYKREKSFIFLVNCEGEHQQLCEIEKNNKKYEIAQLYGKCNKKHEDYQVVYDLIKSNLKKLRQVSC